MLYSAGVDRDTQLDLANVLREYRVEIEEILDDVHQRGTPLSDLEIRLINELAGSQLEFVEDQLRSDEQGSMRPGQFTLTLRLPSWLERLAARLRGLGRPKIGRLHHYPPRPLQVPAAYVRTQPPTPTPTISLVTPSFGQGRFLERTLHSVLGQKYPSLEYFVQDGGSEDETLEILSSYEAQLAGWTSEPDEGQADAINKGFAQTTGDLMGWLNSDDILLPGALSYVARYFVEHPDVDVVYGNRVMIDEDDGEIGLWILPKHDDEVLTLVDFVPQETLFWRRDVWRAAGGSLDPNFGYALDWDLLLRFQAAGATIVHVPRFLGAFRVHDAQKTTADEPLGQAECEQLRERVHGRPVSLDEVGRRLTPYMKQHVLAHAWERARDHLPRKRAPLSTPGPRPQVVASEKRVADPMPADAQEQRHQTAHEV
jgi:hypothetical protein